MTANPRANTETMSTATALVRTLMAQGIDTLYCLPGVQNDDFFDALATTGKSIRPVHTRHEQATAYMALGAALATGEPQAYCVVPGPGFLNTTAALSTAYATNAPVLAIAGQIPERYTGKGVGLLHEIPDQLAIMKGLTKWADRVSDAQQAADKGREAFARMLSGGPRPVALECPMNVWRKTAEVAFDESRIVRKTPAIDQDALLKAAKLLGAAKNPMIIVGGGAQDASAEVTLIAEMLQAPVVAYRNGHGVLDARHPLFAGWLGGYLLWKKVDAVLAIGTRLQQPMDWGADKDLKVVHLEINPERVGVIHKPDITLIADAAEGLAALADVLAKHNTKRADRTADMLTLKAAVAERLSTLAPQKAFLDAIRGALPDNGIFVDELTQVGYPARLMYPAYKPRTFLTSGYQGTLGWGYAAALGAKIAKPDSPVVSINGDGGFLFGAGEMATAIKHNVGVVGIVFADGNYGNVKRIQSENYGRNIAVDLANPDFVKMADSFGMRAMRAKDAAALGKEIKAAITKNEPTLIEVPVKLSDFPSPWPYLMNVPKMRGPDVKS
jgi:acetolactate synthase-1/2/3 large subunit